MKNIRGLTAVLITAILLAIFACNSAVANVAFGSVDADKLFRDYEKRIEVYNEIETLKEKLELQLELRNGNRLLTNDEFQQLMDLEIKPQKTEADNAKIQELQNASRERDRELQDLQQKEDLSEAERARRTELENRLREVNRMLQEDKLKFEEQLNIKLIEANQEISQDIEDAVAAEAEARNLSMVFNKSFGQVEFILYSSLDITDAVLARLNK